MADSDHSVPLSLRTSSWYAIKMSVFTQKLKKRSVEMPLSNKGETLNDQILLIKILKSSGMIEPVNSFVSPNTHICINTNTYNFVYVEQTLGEN